MWYQGAMIFMRRFYWLALIACSFATGCGPDPLPHEARLPRGYDDIMLGAMFDPADSEAQEIVSDDSVQRFRVDRAKNQPAVTVELDDTGRVAQIFWGEYVIDDGRRAAIMRQARERFGDFLKKEIATNGGTEMLFQDESTRYRLVFLRQEIQVSMVDLTYDFEDGGNR